jgi:hypothetical protein
VGLQGTLDTLPALDALEVLARMRREGLLEVRGGGSRATLRMVDGALVGGEVDALVGSVGERDALVLRLVDVLATIARLDQGGFDFRLGRVEAAHGPRVPLDEVLDRARAAADAWSPVAATVPGFDAVPHLVDASEDEPLTVSRSALRLVALVDGRRTVAALGAALGWSAAETIAPLAGLVARGVVAIGAAEPAAPPEPVAPVATDPIVEEVAREQAALAARLSETHRPTEAGPAARALADLAGLADPDTAVEVPAPGPTTTEVSGDATHLAALAAVVDAGGPGATGDPEDADRTRITADRGALLRLFSGLRTDQA